MSNGCGDGLLHQWLRHLGHRSDAAPGEQPGDGGNGDEEEGNQQ